jgi:hypothetical protein
VVVVVVAQIPEMVLITALVAMADLVFQVKVIRAVVV